MNQIEEQKSLVEYLEAALNEARTSSASSPAKVSRIEEEIKEAREEYERLFNGMSVSAESSRSNIGSPAPQPLLVPQADFSLEIKFEPRFKTFVNNFKSIFTREEKVYNLTAKPIETDLFIESIPWYKTIGQNLRSIIRPEPKVYSGITSKPIDTDLILETMPWFRTVF